MEKTTNYKQFKYLSTNRPISNCVVNELIASIKEKNLLEYRPILVDENKSIIDGQHRLKAAEALGVEIFYQVKKNATTKDMIRLNTTQVKWENINFMNAYMQEKNENYIKLSNLMESFKIGVPIAVLFCGFDLRNKSYRGLIRSGEFVFPTDSTLPEFRLTFFCEICELIAQKSNLKVKFKAHRGFASAFMYFIEIGDMNWQIFKQKLNMRMDKVRHCATVTDYLRMLISIYNYHNKNPLGVTNHLDIDI